MNPPSDNDVPAYWTVSPQGFVVRLDGWELTIAAEPVSEANPPRFQGAPSLVARAGWEFRPMPTLGALYQQAGVAPRLPDGAPAPASSSAALAVVPYDAVRALAAWKAKVGWQGDKEPTAPFGSSIPARPQPLATPPRLFLPGPSLVEAMAQADLFAPPPAWFPPAPKGWADRAVRT